MQQRKNNKIVDFINSRVSPDILSVVSFSLKAIGTLCLGYIAFLFMMSFPDDENSSGDGTSKWLIECLLDDESEKKLTSDIEFQKYNYFKCLEKKILENDTSEIFLMFDILEKRRGAFFDFEVPECDSLLENKSYSVNGDSIIVGFDINQPTLNIFFSENTDLTIEQKLHFFSYGDYINTRIIKPIQVPQKEAIAYILVGIFCFITSYLLSRTIKIAENSKSHNNQNYISDSQSTEVIKNREENITVKENQQVYDYIDLNIPVTEKVGQSLIVDIVQHTSTIDYLQSRATLMLVLSLFIAMISLAIFFISIPSDADSKDISIYLIQTIKPALMLIFAQTLVFFLLKQYRVTIEDFKYFHNKLDKKKRLLTTHLILSKEEVQEKELLLTTSLLTFDSDDLIDKDKQSKSVEIIKETDKNPMFSIIEKFFDKIPLGDK